MENNNDIFLPASFNRMSKWPGLRPYTLDNLGSIHALAASRPGGASLAERSLLVACEFWSAAVSRSLIWYLGAEPEIRLRSLANIYAAMGARQAARVMGVAAGEMAGTVNDQRCQRLVEALELALLKKRETIDEAINRFTRRLLSRPVVGASRPVVASGVTREAHAATVRLPGSPTMGHQLPRPYAHFRNADPGAGQYEPPGA